MLARKRRKFHSTDRCRSSTKRYHLPFLFRDGRSTGAGDGLTGKTVTAFVVGNVTGAAVTLLKKKTALKQVTVISKDSVHLTFLILLILFFPLCHSSVFVKRIQVPNRQIKIPIFKPFRHLELERVQVPNRWIRIPIFKPFRHLEGPGSQSLDKDPNF